MRVSAYYKYDTNNTCLCIPYTILIQTGLIGKGLFLYSLIEILNTYTCQRYRKFLTYGQLKLLNTVIVF